MPNNILCQGINFDEEIAKVSDNDLPKSKKTAIIIEEDEFNESDHPRDENGRFTDSGGGSRKKSDYTKGFTEGTNEDLDEAIKSGRAKMTLKSSAQSKYREGTKKYNDAVAKGGKVSTLSISDKEVEKFVTQKSGSGKIYVKKTGQIKETIDCGVNVGEYISRSGKKSQTTRLTVHHSKDGFHAVPASSGGKKE